jgi:hypothetical protein
MMFLLAVILTALAILFLLTALALGSSGQLSHPIRVGGGLVAMLILALALLAE